MAIKDTVQAALQIPQDTQGNPYGIPGARGGSVPSPTFTAQTSAGLGALAQALGVVSNTLDASLDAQEKRNEKFGIAKAQEIISATSDQDKRTLNAIDLIGAYGKDTQLQDNPYAVATIEKMRGQYLSASANDEYQVWRSQQEAKPASASEELKQYNQFMQAKRLHYAGMATNSEAFFAGYDEKQAAQQLTVANQQRTEQEAEYRKIQVGSTKAALGNLMRNYNTMDETTFVNNVQEVMNNARISWMEPSQRIELAQGLLQEVANGPGDVKRISKILSEVTIGTDRNGNEVKMTDVIDPTPFTKLANQRTANLFGERVQGAMESLKKMTIPQQNAWFREQEQKDPDFFDAMVQYRKPIYDYTKHQEDLKAKAALKAQAQASANNQHIANIRSQLEAWNSNSTFDRMGRVVATSAGSLPKVKVTTTDENGNVSVKEIAPPPEVLNQIAAEEISKIWARQDTNEDTKAGLALHVLRAPFFNEFRKSVENTFTTAIDSATIKDIETDRQGWIDANPVLLQTLKMRRTSPGEFAMAFPEELNNKVGLIQSLADARNGDYGDALALYTRARTTMQENKAFVSDQKTNIHKAFLNNPPGSGFTDLLGNSADTGGTWGINSGDLSTNAYAQKMVEDQALMMMCAGMSLDTAMEKAKQTIADNYHVYNGTLVPRGLADVIPLANEEKTRGLKETLDAGLSMFAQDSGIEPHLIEVQYDPLAKGVIFKGGMQQSAVWNRNQILYAFNERQKSQQAQAAQAQDVSRQQAPTVADIMAGRAERPTVEQHPGVSTENKSWWEIARDAMSFTVPD